MKIGIVGSGKIGSVVGRLWAEAGHQVLFSSRHPESLDRLVQAAGANASLGTPADAISFGEAVLLSIPFGHLPEFSSTWRSALAGKVVLETSNPAPARDGEMAAKVLLSKLGTGGFLREWFPETRIVRAFNTVWDPILAKQAHRTGPHLGIPLASDDQEALRVAAGLVMDAGFDPVIVGNLDRAHEFDRATAVFDTGMSGSDVRTVLKLVSAQS